MSDSFLIPASAIRTGSAGLFTRLLLPLALGAAMLSSTGCLFQKKQVRVFRPPPPSPRPSPAPLKLPPDLDPPVMTAASESELDIAALSQVAFDIPPPPPPVQAARPRTPYVASPKPAAIPPPAPEPQALKLVQILPPEQQRGFNRELDEILARDQKTLETVARRNPNAEQRDRMDQIRELLTQAKQAREQDLVTAVNLARRADTLSKDLLERLP